MNYTKKDFILSAVIVVLAILLFFKDCKGNGKTTTTVTIPEVKGKFEAVKPEQKPLAENELSKIDKKTFGQNLSKKELEYWKAEAERLFKENQEMDQAFMNANDSLQQLLYKNAITIKAFNHTFDNDTLSATVTGLVRGEVQKIKLDYTIKERKIEVKQKEVFFRMLAGVEVGNTKQFNDFAVKANVGFQNKKGSILTFAADTEQRFYVGYNFSVFAIKGK
jgi:hypothetical protein